MGKNVEQDLRIGFGIDMTAILLEQLLFQVGGIGQITVMRQRDAVG